MPVSDIDRTICTQDPNASASSGYSHKHSERCVVLVKHISRYMEVVRLT
jgi:hypothetical protein